MATITTMALLKPIQASSTLKASPSVKPISLAQAMATAGAFNTLLKPSPAASRRPLPTSSAIPAVRIPLRNFSVVHRRRGTLSLRPRAVTDDDEWGKDASGNAAVVVAEESPSAPEIGKLKLSLKEKLYGTNRGLKASSETRAEIVEVITQLEALNPTPAPTEALSLLNGKWILAYTSFSGLFPLLAMQRMPQLVKVDEISQTIDSDAFTVQNSVRFTGPLATTSLSTNAKFEVRSPKRVQIKFEEGIIGTPQLTDSIVLPEKLEVFGQSVDLSPFKGVFTSIQDAAASIAKTISGRPPLKLPISSSNAQSWLLTTYLDEELRISRGDGGSVFVLIKEGCALLD